MPAYPVGPGHHSYSRGPVLTAYAETDALERVCPNCHAPVGEFCRHPEGTQRRIPCPKRLSPAAAKAQEEQQ